MFVIFIRSFLGTNYFTSLFIGPLEALKRFKFYESRQNNSTVNDDYNYVYLKILKATNFVRCLLF